MEIGQNDKYSIFVSICRILSLFQLPCSDIKISIRATHVCGMFQVCQLHNWESRSLLLQFIVIFVYVCLPNRQFPQLVEMLTRILKVPGSMGPGSVFIRVTDHSSQGIIKAQIWGPQVICTQSHAFDRKTPAFNILYLVTVKWSHFSQMSFYCFSI